MSRSLKLNVIRIYAIYLVNCCWRWIDCFEIYSFHCFRLIMQTLLGTIFGMLWLTKASYFYSCNAKLVLYNINYLIHAFLKYPEFVIFNLSVYEINPFRKFFKEDTGFCRWYGRLISSALMPTHCHVALVDRFWMCLCLRDFIKIDLGSTMSILIA